MIDQNSPQARDVMSVGTRISWGAIWAGSILSLAICLLMTTLGGAVGLSIHARFPATSLHLGSVVWAFLTVCTALFVGGLLTSLLTVGENKTEAVVHGILMWALLLGIFLLVGATGIRSGFTLLSTRMESPGIGSSIANEGTASAASPDSGRNSVEINSDAAKRLAWYSFAGTWLSMLAAAAGAFLGAGPTFRVAIVPRNMLPAS